MTEKELRDFQMWNFTKFGTYLKETGVLPPIYNEAPDAVRRWIDNELNLEFINGLTHIVRISEPSFKKESGFFQLYGIDFIMDESLKLWLVECNLGPALIGTSTEKYELIYKLVKDLFEIEFGLLRSRLKRTMALIWQIRDEIYQEVSTMMTLQHRKNIEELIKGYLKEKKKKNKLIEKLKKANFDGFESEFEPSGRNNWISIVNKGEKNASKVYHPSFDKSCL